MDGWMGGWVDGWIYTIDSSPCFTWMQVLERQGKTWNDIWGMLRAASAPPMMEGLNQLSGQLGSPVSSEGSLTSEMHQTSWERQDGKTLPKAGADRCGGSGAVTKSCISCRPMALSRKMTVILMCGFHVKGQLWKPQEVGVNRAMFTVFTVFRSSKSRCLVLLRVFRLSERAKFQKVPLGDLHRFTSIVVSASNGSNGWTSAMSWASWTSWTCKLRVELSRANQGKIANRQSRYIRSCRFSMPTTSGVWSLTWQSECLLNEQNCLACADRVALPSRAAVKQLPSKLDAVNDIPTSHRHAEVRSIWCHLVKMSGLLIQAAVTV